MRRASGQTSSASELDTATAQVAPAHDPIGLEQAIARGVIREQDVIAVLTEMCQCLLVARRKQSEDTSADTSTASERASTRNDVSERRDRMRQRMSGQALAANTSPG